MRQFVLTILIVLCSLSTSLLEAGDITDEDHSPKYAANSSTSKLLSPVASVPHCSEMRAASLAPHRTSEDEGRSPRVNAVPPVGNNRVGVHPVREVSYTSASGQEVKAETGTMEVPENRSNPASATIEVSYIWLKKLSADNKSNKKRKGQSLPPVFYLEGGPGSSASWQAENPNVLESWLPLLQTRDLILYDQRGTGQASRRLTYISFAPPAKEVLTTEETVNEHIIQMTKKALPHWKEQGIDIRGYNTLENARDIDALRQKMGLDKIALLGFSYGTHLGQTYLKYFGEHVERAILIGVEGLDETFKVPTLLDDQLTLLSQMVAADPVISKQIPDFTALYQRVSDRLAENPVEMTLRNPINGQDIEMLIGKFGLDLILWRDFGDASDLPVFPRLLYSIDQGNYAPFQWFVQKRISAAFGLQAMSISTDVASGLSQKRAEMIKDQASKSRFGNTVNSLYNAFISVAPDLDLGHEFRAPFTTDVPVLLLSGSLDSNTPAYQAEKLHKMLSNSTHIIVENAGHEQIIRNKAAGKAIVQFLMGQDVSNIEASDPPLEFIPLTGKDGNNWHPALGERE